MATATGSLPKPSYPSPTTTTTTTTALCALSLAGRCLHIVRGRIQSHPTSVWHRPRVRINLFEKKSQTRHSTRHHRNHDHHRHHLAHLLLLLLLHCGSRQNPSSEPTKLHEAIQIFQVASTIAATSHSSPPPLRWDGPRSLLSWSETSGQTRSARITKPPKSSA